MKMLRILFFSLVFMLGNHLATAQAKFEFGTSNHDFGEIIDGKVVSHDFIFTNIGNEPLIIKNVKASCGCTTPYWTNVPVLPGKKGKITASYNSKNRPGNFNKTITITSNATEASKVLQIRGATIKPGQLLTSSTPEQLAKSAKIEINQKAIFLGKVGISQTIPFQIKIKNTGKSKLAIVNAQSGCKCIKIDPGTKRVYQPGESGMTQLLFSPRSIGDFKDKLVIDSNDFNNRKTTIDINAQIVENLVDNSVVQEKQSIKF